MANDKLDGVITKVKRLQALAAQNTCEAEMLAATAAADRIIQEYRLTSAMLEEAGEAHIEPMVTKVVSKGGRRTAWRETLLHAITAHYGSCWYLSSGRNFRGKGECTYTVVGQESDVAIVEYMFTYLEGECERLSRWHSGGKGVKFAVSFLGGCAQGIATQYQRMADAKRAQAQAAMGTTSAALAILDKRESVSRAHMEESIGTKKAKHVSGGGMREAFLNGLDVGKTIQLKDGLGEGKKTPLLT